MAPPEVVSTKPCTPLPTCKEIPILYSASMALATLDGSKTQTRRAIKVPRRGSFVLMGDDEHADGGPWWPYQSDDGESSVCDDGCEHFMPCPYGQPGDRLWGRETLFAWGRWETRYSAKKGRDEWHFVDMTLECGKAYLYAADGPRPQPLAGKRDGGVTPKWWKRPAIFMPRVASRIDLEVTGVRAERLQDISQADAIAEGLSAQPGGGWGLSDGSHFHLTDPRVCYASLWEAINGAGSWNANPWVWCVSFRRIRP